MSVILGGSIPVLPLLPCLRLKVGKFLIVSNTNVLYEFGGIPGSKDERELVLSGSLRRLASENVEIRAKSVVAKSEDAEDEKLPKPAR